VVKGQTTNFNPASTFFNVIPEDAPPGEPALLVEMAHLKAVFFVRDFQGDPKRDDRQVFLNSQPYQGAKIEVEFQDGELMVGSTPNYGPDLPGFFVFPADTDSNMLKAFVVSSSVKKVCTPTGEDRRGGTDRRGTPE